MEFSVQAKLGYRVQQETPFVFNMQAQSFTWANDPSVSLRIEPELQTESWTMPESGNSAFLSYRYRLALSRKSAIPETKRGGILVTGRKIPPPF